MNGSNELCFLATIFMKPELIKQIVIPIECIENGLNRFVLQAFMFTYKQSGVIDIPSLLQENKRGFEGKYNEADFMGVVSKLILIDDEYLIEDFDYYQQLLFEDYKDRLLKQTIKDYDNKKISQDEFLTKVHEIENKTIDTSKGNKSVEEIEQLVLTEKKNIPIRFTNLSNRITLQEHNLMVISARTGVGKSGFALNLLEDLSKKYKCILFNLEMSESAVYRRLISIMSSVPMNTLNKPQTDYQKEAIKKNINELSQRKLKILTGSQTIQSIRRRIIEEQREEHLIVFIDYVGLINSTEKHKSLYEHITAVVKELREISLDFNCTIILLAQINRNGDDNPKLRDLKESGELEQSATQVLILSGTETTEDEQEIIIDLAKNREGKTGKTKLIYNRANQRFKEIF